jgi:hypothetical protein
MNEIIRAALLTVSAVLFAISPAGASPGAHGPNGEHLDGAAATATAGTAPRFEAKSEAFEMVGRLSGGELSMFINRYDTNEPVDKAKVELELGNLKATAPFHEDQGDYAVADEAFLKALAKPGQHALVITLVAGKDSDLLEGTLVVPEAGADDHGHEHGLSRRVLAGVAAFVVLAALAIGWRLRTRRRTRGLALQGGLQ